MARDVVGNLRRQQRRLRELGGGRPRCVLCGESDWRTLKPVEVSSLPADLVKFLEDHHVLGHNHDPDFKVPLCRNCHAKVSARQLEFGADLRRKETLLARLPEMLRSDAAFLYELSVARLDLADQLERESGQDEPDE